MLYFINVFGVGLIRAQRLLNPETRLLSLSVLQGDCWNAPSHRCGQPTLRIPDSPQSYIRSPNSLSSHLQVVPAISNLQGLRGSEDNRISSVGKITQSDSSVPLVTLYQMPLSSSPVTRHPLLLEAACSIFRHV